ncbi:DMT family transporter [Pseudonocardia humida]|uniref:DMT family transporter n=1 Tax=Pseudonocardia humida TaxID=2800819 RepID=A0ABT1A405_9PSEU|nr:DMT family transporter [Pseudonocardia humida]MCO1657681.1 DMT family transporter [Pseudonocardia humida]
MHPALAVVLALASAACYALSAVLQHHEASRQPESGVATLMIALMHRKGWWAAQTATILGALLHLAALGAGPLVLVQPIGVTALALALPVGARIGRTPVTRRAWIGALCVVVGLPGVLTAIPHQPGTGRIFASFPTVACVVAVIVATATLCALRIRRTDPLWAAILLAGAAALCFGTTSAAVKALWLQMGSPTVVAIGLIAAPLGVVLAQHAYQDGGLGAPLAVQTLADPVTAVAIGVLSLGEQLAGTPVRIAFGLLGFAVTVAGVVLLSSRIPSEDHTHGPRPVASPAAAGADG